MIDTSKVFTNIPTGLRSELLNCYEEIITNYSQHRWEPSELNGGKICEIVYSIINGYLTGSFPPKAYKPRNMVAACQALEKIPSLSTRAGDRSVRVLIPRILPVLYEVRNNRNVGHVGGDVDANLMDALFVVNTASWLMAELIRIFHDTSPQSAQDTVSSLVERKHPIVWEVGHKRRVLDHKMKTSDQVLLHLYLKTGWTSVQDLREWVEYGSNSLFRSRILVPLHKSRLIEFDAESNLLKISPSGVTRVEKSIVKS
jgi:hypothetical protein